MADLTIRIRANADQANAAFREFGTALTGIDRATQAVGRSSGAAAAATSNLAAQFQDIAIMMQMGANPLTIAAQQGTQIAAALGQGGAAGAAGLLRGALANMVSPVTLVTFAVIAGASALVSWASEAMGAGRSSESFADSVKNLQSAVDRLREANNAFSTEGIDRLIERYGALNAEVLLLVSRQQQVAENEALAEAAQAVDNLRESYATLLGSDAGDIADLLGLPTGTRIEFMQASEEVARFQSLIETAMNTSEPEAMADALADIITMLEGAGQNTSVFYGELVNAESALRELVAQGDGVNSWLGAAITNTNTWVGKLWEAVTAAASISIGEAVESTQFQGPRPPARPDDIDFAYDGPPVFDGPRPPVRPMDLDLPEIVTGSGTGSRPSGGGSAGGVDRELQAAQREAERIIERNRTALEEYNAEVERVTELHEQGLLPLDQFNREMDRLGTELDEAQFGDFRKEIQGIADDLAQAIVNGDDLGDMFGSLVKRMASDLIASGLESLMLSAFGPLSGGTSTGGGLGGLFAGIFGGFRANGGPVSAGTGYVVGERGPEFFVPSTSGMILPSGRGTSPAGAAQAAGMGGGGGAMTINVNVAGARGNAEIEAMVASGVTAGLGQYDRALPSRVQRIQSDRRMR
jgi:hypothetical protein